MSYDQENVFAKILRGEIPCDKIYEDDHALAFRDLDPKAPAHVLVIPKGEYENFDQFAAHAPAALMAGFLRAIGEVSRLLKVETKGYRLIANCGPDGGQEVPHLHVHILAGRPLGPLLTR